MGGGGGGGGYGFLFRSELIFRTTREFEYLFFCRVQVKWSVPYVIVYESLFQTYRATF
jgi:hypothetical protein